MRKGSPEGGPNCSPLGLEVSPAPSPPPPPNGVEEDPNMSNMGLVGFGGGLLPLGFSSAAQPKAPPLLKLLRALLVKLALRSS